MDRALIADADQEARTLLSEVLSQADCRAEFVTRGEEVLCRVSAEDFHLLIAEVHLPDMEAWELIPRVRRLAPDLPIIATTADVTWETSRRVRMEGGPIFFYAPKPLDLREMQEVVACVRRWRRRQGSNRGVFRKG